MKQERWTIGGWGGSVRRVPAEEPGEVRCLSCQGALEMHQPEPDRPESLLGTCASCGAWHIVATTAAGWEIIAVELPGTSPNGSGGADRAGIRTPARS